MGFSLAEEAGTERLGKPCEYSESVNLGTPRVAQDHSRAPRVFGDLISYQNDGKGRAVITGKAGTRPASPLVAYRWAHTDAALTAQLELEAEGVRRPRVREPEPAAHRSQRLIRLAAGSAAGVGAAARRVASMLPQGMPGGRPIMTMSAARSQGSSCSRT